MTRMPRRWSGIGLVFGICLLLGIGAATPAQQVPISFNDYHGYTGTSIMSEGCRSLSQHHGGSRNRQSRSRTGPSPSW